MRRSFGRECLLLERVWSFESRNGFDLRTLEGEEVGEEVVCGRGGGRKKRK